MVKQATYKIILNPKSKEEKKNLVIRITHNRTWRIYSLGGAIKLTPEQFEKKNLKVTKDALLEIQESYNKAITIISQLDINFEFDTFLQLYTDANFAHKKVPNNKKTIRTIYEEYFSEKNLSYSTKASYITLVYWIEEFNPKLRLKDFTPEKITELVEYIKTHSLEKINKVTNDTSISMYLRGFRAIYNWGIEKGYTTKDKYPFGKYGFKFSTKIKVKKALTDKEFDVFINCNPINKKEQLGYDFFMLSYYLYGLNIADIVTIKNKDLKGNYISYERTKTQNSKAERKQIDIPIDNVVVEILERYGRIDSNNPNEYILPFISLTDTEEQLVKKKMELNKQINKGLKSICERVGIEKFTFYSGRHTFVTNAFNDGVNIAVISKVVGHSNTNTTQLYFDSIDQNNAQKLLNVVAKRKK